MTDLSHITQIIEAGEYDHYGLRAHRGETPVIGNRLGNSFVWVDGECTDEELNGTSTLIIDGDIQATIERLHSEYSWDAEQIVLVGGDVAETGFDDGELIIRNGLCLAIL